MSKINYPNEGQITLDGCKELVAGLEPDTYHLYYKRLIGSIEENLKEYIKTSDLEEALGDAERYGSLFLRTGEVNNWTNQYQVVDNNSLKPI